MPTNSVLTTTDYIFSPQTMPAMAASQQTITLTPVPLGVNARQSGDPPHYLLLVTATSWEAVPLDIGGTAVSGASSGTIMFTPANAYGAGAASLQTATAGIQEAIFDAADNNGIYIPPGIHFVYGTVTVPQKQLAIFGEGIQASKVVRKFTSGHLFDFPSTIVGIVNFRKLELTSDVTVTSGAQLNLVGFNHGVVSDLYLNAISGGLKDGIAADKPNGTMFSNIEIREVTGVGLKLTCTAGESAGLYTNIAISATSSATRILLEANSSHGFVGPVFSNIIMQGGAFGFYLNANNGNVNEGRVSNLIADSHTDTAIYMAGSGAGGTGGGQSWSFNNVVSGVASTASSIFIDSGYTNIQFSNINVGPRVGSGNAVVELAACNNVQFTNCVISGRGVGGSNDVAVLIRTNTVGVQTKVCHQIAFTNCVIGYNQNGDVSGTNYAQYGFKVPAGDHELVSIQSCKIFGATDAMSLSFGSGASCFLSDNLYASTGAVTKPTASAVFRKSTWFTEGTPDQYEICSKNSGGSYVWQTLI